MAFAEDEDLIEVFKEESSELLEELEAALLKLEKSPHEQELIQVVFRVMHNIKGAAQMFGFDEIGEFTHKIETFFDRVRNGEIQIDEVIISLTLAARDQILGMLELPGGEQGSDVGKMEKILDQFISIQDTIEAGTSNTNSVLGEKVKVTEYEFDDESETDKIFWVRLVPEETILSDGTDPVDIIAELQKDFDCIVVAQSAKVPDINSIDVCNCYLFWDILIKTPKGLNTIKDTFMFLEGKARIEIEKLYEDPDDRFLTELDGLQDVLTLSGEEDPEFIIELLKAKIDNSTRFITVAAVENKAIETVSNIAASQDKIIIEEKERSKKMLNESSFIRVHSFKLDNQVNLVGELVTLKARLSQAVVNSTDKSLQNIMEEIERLVEELRDCTMSMRMVPVGSLFNKFKRLVRDLSKDLDKDIELLIEGAETELDKTMIEKLNDPLMHLIRNSIDHGIETKEERDETFKPKKAVIMLSAVHSGSEVLIQVQDDGRGMSSEKIRTKAIEKGLITKVEELSDKDLFKLVFLPGFSTVQNVSDVSGRGVGMDVVQKTISALRGSIDVNSYKGNGTEIVLRLPLTVAIIDGLLVKVAKDFFVVPLSTIEECVELTREGVNNSHGNNLIEIRNELVPYIRLRDQFRIPGEGPPIEQIIVSNYGDHRIGVVVDEVIGEQQVVLKSLGKVYKNVVDVSGATVLGDGTVALILDIQQMVKKEMMRKRYLSAK